MLGRIAGAVRFKEHLSFHTSLRIGGPAEFFIVPQNLDDVRYALAFAEQEGLPVVTLGGGNNMVVADDGIKGVVLKLQGMFARTEFHGDEVVVGAGVNLGTFIREAAARGLGGLEWLAGIPATVGGALAMNVGAQERSICASGAQIYFLHPDGTLAEARTVAGSPIATFRAPVGGVVLGCRMTLMRRPTVQINKDINQRLKQKKASEPFALAAAGYVWKNPPGDTATRLIAKAGLCGKRINNAEISVKCANLILNRGGATASDVLALMEMTRDRVAAHSGVMLEAEIRTFGFEAPTFEPQPLELVPA